MNQLPSKPAARNSQQPSRGPNVEAIETAQENVSEGYGSSSKASIISGKPDEEPSKSPKDESTG